MAIETEWRDYDVVVVGSGGAGSAAANAAAQSGARVLVVSKDPIGCSDTKISEGAVTVRGSGDAEDNEQELSDNLRVAGGNLPVKAITDAFAKDSQTAYDWYRTHGLRPNIDAARNGPKPMPLPMGGHTKGRTVRHKNSGVALSHANWSAVVQGERIDYLEDTWFLDLVTTRGAGDGSRRIAGGILYDASRGKLVAVRAPSVVIAAGGLSTLFFPKTDTMRGNTGDSYAIAARAGAELVDMEQLQFLPFCVASPPSYEGLLIGEPSTASFLGVLRDKNGKVILNGVYLRTRAECSAAIMRAVADGRGTENGGAYLDMTANAQATQSGPYFMRYLKSSLPTAYSNARQALGRAAANCEEPWEVRPAAHYMMGGISVNEDGAAIAGNNADEPVQEIAGLFAAGQAMGGVFGANRLGSTALSENAVFGLRSGRAAASFAQSAAQRQNPPNDETLFKPLLAEIATRFGQSGSHAAAALKIGLQSEAWDCIGPVRTAASLSRMDALTAELNAKLGDIAIPSYAVWNQAFIEFEELRNMLAVAEAVTSAAKERDGSLGGHVRLDGPEISPFAQPYSTIVRKDPDDSWPAHRIARLRLSFGRLVIYLLKDHWRKFRSKMLRMMPKGVRDKRLLKFYLGIMGGPDGKAPEISPGSSAGAVAEGSRF
jgi:fumarate reductase (CoM/CoB) subunit A